MSATLRRATTRAPSDPHRAPLVHAGDAAAPAKKSNLTLDTAALKPPSAEGAAGASGSGTGGADAGGPQGAAGPGARAWFSHLLGALFYTQELRRSAFFGARCLRSHRVPAGFYCIA
jgi:hypothetical protein